jgi:hypothetical protein
MDIHENKKGDTAQSPKLAHAIQRPRGHSETKIQTEGALAFPTRTMKLRVVEPRIKLRKRRCESSKAEKIIDQTRTRPSNGGAGRNPRLAFCLSEQGIWS